jgi:hypothetical protein
MQFGFDENGQRIKPSFSGQRSTCGLCGNELIAHCGEINVWHWQHHVRGCDPWKEHETKWHRIWKENFPDSWREVIIVKDGKKHIADVQTGGAIVIEFQNSSISTSTIQIREEFYGDMIWVINANAFRGNFEMRSVVNLHIKSIKSEIEDRLYSSSNNFRENLADVQNQVDENSNKITNNIQKLDSKFKSLEILEKIKNNFDDFATNVIDKWSHSQLFCDFNTMEITRNVDDGSKQKLQEIPLSLGRLRAGIEAKEEEIIDWENRESIEIDGKIFRVVSYETIDSSELSEIRVISKSSRETFFPDIRTVATEFELQRYKFQKNSTDFFFDPTKTIQFLKRGIEKDKTDISVFENSFLNLKAEIKTLIAENLENRIQFIKQELNELQFSDRELVSEKDILLDELHRLNQEKKETVSVLQKELEKQGKIRQSKVMRDKKGLYLYSWKNERKCWRASHTSIFFDIGEDYLFEKIERGLFKKVLISSFLEKHITNG